LLPYFGIGFQHLTRVYTSGSTYGKSKKYVQEHISFEESQCTSVDEIDQDTPASSALQFTESDF